MGICYGLPSGQYSITLTSYIPKELSGMYIGFATNASRFYVEELGQHIWSSGNFIKSLLTYLTVNTSMERKL